MHNLSNEEKEQIIQHLNTPGASFTRTEKLIKWGWLALKSVGDTHQLIITMTGYEALAKFEERQQEEQEGQ